MLVQRLPQSGKNLQRYLARLVHLQYVVHELVGQNAGQVDGRDVDRISNAMPTAEMSVQGTTVDAPSYE
jgi:hypothetical protein